MTNDANTVQNGVNLVLRLFLRSPFIVFGAMVMAFFIDVKCALVFLVAIVLLSIVIFSIMAYTTPGYKKVQSNLDGVTLITRENFVLSQVKITKLLNLTGAILHFQICKKVSAEYLLCLIR